jgi:hypothetical protein
MVIVANGIASQAVAVTVAVDGERLTVHLLQVVLIAAASLGHERQPRCRAAFGFRKQISWRRMPWTLRWLWASELKNLIGLRCLRLHLDEVREKFFLAAAAQSGSLFQSRTTIDPTRGHLAELLAQKKPSKLRHSKP